MKLNQATILHPVSDNKAGKKVKAKAEKRHNGKKRLSIIIALKLIAKQGANETAKIEE